MTVENHRDRGESGIDPTLGAETSQKSNRRDRESRETRATQTSAIATPPLPTTTAAASPPPITTTITTAAAANWDQLHTDLTSRRQRWYE